MKSKLTKWDDFVAKVTFRMVCVCVGGEGALAIVRAGKVNSCKFQTLLILFIPTLLLI